MSLFLIIFFEFLILVISCLLQILPRLKNRYYGIDTWRWLLYADEIRKTGRLPDKIDKYIVEGPFNAPPLLLVLIAKCFPTRHSVEKFNFLVNPFFNILENIALFSFVFILTKNGVIALFSSLIFALTPADIIENSDLNMRSLGKLTFELGFVSLCLFLWKGGVLFGLIFACCVSLVLLAHRMSTQFLLALTFLISVMTFQFSLLFYFLTGILIAIGVSKGFYLRVAKNHFSILKFWWQNQHNRFANMLTGHVTKSSLSNVMWIFLKRLFSRNPYLFLTVPFLIMMPFSVLPEAVAHAFQLTIFLAVFFAIFTTFVPFFVFLGDGYRYIGLISFQVATLVGIHIFALSQGRLDHISLVFLVISVGISLAVIFLWVCRISRQQDSDVTFSFTKPFQEIIHCLDQNNGFHCHFMSVPPIADDAVAYFSAKTKVAFHDNGVALLKSVDYFPVVKDLKETLRSLRIDYCLFHRNLFAKSDFELTAILGEPLYRDSQFLFYKIRL